MSPDPNDRLVNPAEHITADNLKCFVDLCLFIQILLIPFNTLKFILDLLFCLCQITGNLRYTVIVDQSCKPVSAVRQIFIFKVVLQFLIEQSHCDL